MCEEREKVICGSLRDLGLHSRRFLLFVSGYYILMCQVMMFSSLHAAIRNFFMCRAIWFSRWKRRRRKMYVMDENHNNSKYDEIISHYEKRWRDSHEKYDDEMIHDVSVLYAEIINFSAVYFTFSLSISSSSIVYVYIQF